MAVNLSALYQVDISPSISSSRVSWTGRTYSSFQSFRTYRAHLVYVLSNHLPATLIFLTHLLSRGLVIEDISEYASDTSPFDDASPSLTDIDEDSVSSPNSEISPMKERFGRFGMSSSFVHDGNEDGSEHGES
jgi:hypothetical protein